MNNAGHQSREILKRLSPRTNLQMVFRAFAGRRRARDFHRYYTGSPRTIQAGLDVIASRWPALSGASTETPIFIFSAGWRSGSTFLQRLVMSRDDILIWGEPYRHAGIVDSLANEVRAFTHKWPWDEFFIETFPSLDLQNQWVANCYPTMDDFLSAHVTYFERLFSYTAAKLGKKRWGIKEVTLNVDHAHYLKWVFPRAKFVFLIRNPYQAYSSYRKWSTWYKTWPNEPIFTPTAFGRLWKNLAHDYARNYKQVDGRLVYYETLNDTQTTKMLEDYLGFALTSADSLSRLDGHQSVTHGAWVPKIERLLLNRQVGSIAKHLGYRKTF